MKKFLFYLFLSFILSFSIFGHDVRFETIETNATIVKIKFGDDTPYSHEKCEIFLKENNIEKLYQVVFTDPNGMFAFAPIKDGDYKVKCFREDGHGINFQLNKKNSVPILEKSNLSDQIIRYLIGISLIFGLFFLLWKYKNFVTY